MKFICLISAEKMMEHLSEADAAALFQDYAAFTERIKASGEFVAANRLLPPETATTLRVRDGKLQITDGPFAETKEMLGGYYLIDAVDLNAAIAIAAQIPGARFGSVEVRAVADDAPTRALGFDAPLPPRFDPAQQLASGSFDVTTTPQPAADTHVSPGPGRMLLTKQFSGDLTATGNGEMLTSISATPGSTGYVAIKYVTGSLHGRSGSFMFQHSGTMTGGTRVVPDSGTDELVGIAGEFSITTVDGKHQYEFAYTLPETATS